jgi:hypothetical protein
MSHRCRTEPEFALAVYAQIKTDRGREMFLTVYGAPALRGKGSTIAQVRKKVSGGIWAWEAELTVPPPPQCRRREGYLGCGSQSVSTWREAPVDGAALTIARPALAQDVGDGLDPVGKETRE